MFPGMAERLTKEIADLIPCSMKDEIYIDAPTQSLIFIMDWMLNSLFVSFFQADVDHQSRV